MTMKAVGIICEYHPLHRGHAFLMESLRRKGAEAIVCAMSGNFVQRGEVAMVNKFARAEMAVRCGADLVLELPTPWACAPAETFARGGVQLLAETGVVTHLAFGSECGDIAALRAAAEELLRPDFSCRVRAHMTDGSGYAAARQRAAAERLGDGAAMLERPNDTLGVEYCKALLREGSPMEAVTIRRRGAGHDSAGEGTFVSSSRLRQLLRQGRAEEALARMPEEAARVLRRELESGRAPAETAAVERAILARLRQMEEEEFARFDSGREGLYHRLYQAVRRATSLEEIEDLAVTKRYPRARLRRMLLWAWLGLETVPARPPYLRVLSANGVGRQLLRQMADAGAPVLTKPADVARLGPEAEALFAAESRRTDLYALACPDLKQSACGADWRAVPLML
jgi:predicted nucleotidyltransferase